MALACDLPGERRSLGAAFPDPEIDLSYDGDATPQSIVIGGGCFWCVEAVFRQVDGVLDAVSGYAGGKAADADYKAVCGGRTGHAEVVDVTFDPRRISLGQILKLFFSVAHDPTQKDRQGNDVGTQYRSAIFTRSAEQRRVAEAYIRQLDRDRVFVKPIATVVNPLEAFFRGEDYHQDYAARNPYQPYIQYVSLPKVQKLQETFPEKLRRR